MNQENKLSKLKELLSLVNDGLTKHDFVKAFKMAMDIIAKSEVKLFERVDKNQTKNLTEIKSLKDEVEVALKNLQTATDSTFASLRQRAMESITNLFSRMQMNEKVDAVIQQCKDMMGQMDSKMMEMPDVNAMMKEIMDKMPPETGETIVDKINTLPTDDDDLKIAIEHIKGLEERLRKAESGSRHTVIASQRGQVKLYDLSDQLNGVLKTFSLPAFWRVIDVKSSSTPNAFRPTTDYTTDAGAMTITFTSQIDAGSTLAAGQTLLVEYAES